MNLFRLANSCHFVSDWWHGLPSTVVLGFGVQSHRACLGFSFGGPFSGPSACRACFDARPGLRYQLERPQEKLAALHAVTLRRAFRWRALCCLPSLLLALKSCTRACEFDSRQHTLQRTFRAATVVCGKASPETNAAETAKAGFWILPNGFLDVRAEL